MRDGGRSRSSAALRAWLLAMGVGLALLVLVAVALVPYAVDILRELQAGQDEVETFVADLQLPTWLSTFVTDVIEKAEGFSGDAISAAVGSAANLVGIVIIAVFLLYFFLRDGDKAWAWLFQWVGEEKRERITTVGDETLGRVGNYVRGTTVLATISAVSSLVFMLILGTPVALPLALLAFVTAYIPYFGGAIAGIIIVLVTWGAVDATAALIMVGLLLARFAVVHVYVRPRAYQPGPHGPPGTHPHRAAGRTADRRVGRPRPGSPDHGRGRERGPRHHRHPGAREGAGPARHRAQLARPRRPVELASPGGHRLRGPAGADHDDRPAGGAAGHPGAHRRLHGLAPVRCRPAPGTVTHGGRGGRRRWRRHRHLRRARLGAGFARGAGCRRRRYRHQRVPGSINEAAGGVLGVGTDAIESGTESGVQVILDASNEIAGLAVAVILTVLLTFYFLRDGGGMWTRLMSHIPDDAAGQLSEAGARAFGVLGGYMVGTAAISFVGAASQAVIMWVLGLPLVMPIFVLSFFGGFIPYIGSLLTTGLAFLIAVQSGSTLDIVIMGIWTLVFNIVQGNIVAPMVYNRTTSIHPAIVLACIPAASAISGILGMFLVVPVLGVVLTTWRTILRVIGSDDDDFPGPPETSPEDPGDPAIPAEAAAPEPT